MSPTSPAAATAAPPTSKERLLEVFEREHKTTARVLRAYPDDELDLKPHERLKSARELAWFLAMAHGMLAQAMASGIDWSRPPAIPEPPRTIAEIVDVLDREYGRLVEVLRGMSDDDLAETLQVPVAPKTLGEISKLDFLWFILHDHIHHRGQFSIYLRLAGGKVPSIYGPTADEPWR
jgi:uncharacterized damage-inducible protein DinB